MTHKKKRASLTTEGSSEDRRNNEFLGLYEVLSPLIVRINTSKVTYQMYGY